MPNFENLEKYEAIDPQSQERRMIPIAPHSMQAVTYRPMRRASQRPAKPDPKPAFKPVAFEPVSVEQMEREFRQAGRGLGGPGPFARIAKALKKWLGKLKAALRGKSGKKNRNKHPRSLDKGRKGNKGHPNGPQKGPGNGPQGQPRNGPQGRPDDRPHDGDRRRRRNRKPKQDSRHGSNGPNAHAPDAPHPKAAAPEGRQPDQRQEGRQPDQRQEGRQPDQRRSNRSKRRRSGPRPNQGGSGNQGSPNTGGEKA